MESLPGCAAPLCLQLSLWLQLILTPWDFESKKKKRNIATNGLLFSSSFFNNDTCDLDSIVENLSMNVALLLLPFVKETRQTKAREEPGWDYFQTLSTLQFHNRPAGEVQSSADQ